MKAYNKEYTIKNGQKLTLRTPVVEDAQALIDQMKAVDSESKFLAREPGEFNLTVKEERAFLERNLDNESGLFIIGEVKGKIVANCSVGIINNKKRYLHRAALGIAVSKEYWGQGIGTIMMNECINWCKDNGVEQLELEVVTENVRGIALYESLGFVNYGTKKHALKYADGTYADEYEMILFLNDVKRK